MGKLVNNLIILTIIYGLHSSLIAQSAREKSSPKTVNVDVVLVPSPPAGPVPVPYPNLRINYRLNQSQPSVIARGKTLIFELSGSNLENIGSVQVYQNNSKNNDFDVKLESTPRGARGVKRRILKITPKNLSSGATVFKINFRKDRNAEALYTKEFSQIVKDKE